MADLLVAVTLKKKKKKKKKRGSTSFFCSLAVLDSLQIGSVLLTRINPSAITRRRNGRDGEGDVEI